MFHTQGTHTRNIRSQPILSAAKLMEDMFFGRTQFCQSNHVQRIFTGLPYGNPSRKMGRLLFFLFSVSVKVVPVTSLVSGVFVHRALCAYFLRIERVVEMRRFFWWTQENH